MLRFSIPGQTYIFNSLCRHAVHMPTEYIAADRLCSAWRAAKPPLTSKPGGMPMLSKWFVPPIVVPIGFVVLVIAGAIFRGSFGA